MLPRHGQGRYREVLSDARRVEHDFPEEFGALALLPRWAVIPSVNVHVFSANSLAELGDFEGAQRHCDAAYRELQTADHAYSHILLDWVQGSLWLAQSRYAEAVRLFEDARLRCRSQDVPTMEPPIVARLSEALARQGQAAQALELVESAVQSQLDRLGGGYSARAAALRPPFRCWAGRRYARRRSPATPRDRLRSSAPAALLRSRSGRCSTRTRRGRIRRSTFPAVTSTASTTAILCSEPPRATASPATK